MAAFRYPSPRHVVAGFAVLSLMLYFIPFLPLPPRPDFSTSLFATNSDRHLYGHDTLSSLQTQTQGKEVKKLYGSDYAGRSEPADVNRVANGTLGFERVFVVGLPDRGDRRDAVALTSALTGFQVDWVDGVRGEQVPDKAVPFGVDRKALWEANLGSWRGHMNAVRRIVQEDLDSALIMEDDMDWDVRLKPQLERVAQGVRSLLSSSSSTTNHHHHHEPPPRSPYGDDWDLLWLGHCGEVFPETLDENKIRPADDPALARMSRKYAIDSDPTVPPRDRVTGLVDFAAYPPHTRWVHRSGAPICTFAYALSRRGARKVLFDLSVDRLEGAFDNALAGMCRKGVASSSSSGGGSGSGGRGLDAKCVSVTPPLFFHHKARGRVSGDSDIQVVGGDGAEVREKGTTENIVWSARGNIRGMIRGDVRMESQFEEEEGVGG